MSHFVHYDCKVNDLNAIKKSLLAMNLSYQENASITDYYKETRNVALAVKKNDQLLPIGFEHVNGEYKLVADWYRTGFQEKQFTETLQQNHDQFVALSMLENQNWYVESIQKNQNGELVISASKWS